MKDPQGQVFGSFVERQRLMLHFFDDVFEENTFEWVDVRLKVSPGGVQRNIHFCIVRYISALHVLWEGRPGNPGQLRGIPVRSGESRSAPWNPGQSANVPRKVFPS